LAAYLSSAICAEQHWSKCQPIGPNEADLKRSLPGQCEVLGIGPVKEGLIDIDIKRASQIYNYIYRFPLSLALGYCTSYLSFRNRLKPTELVKSIKAKAERRDRPLLPNQLLIENITVLVLY
jgi:hypothetical protein